MSEGRREGVAQEAKKDEKRSSGNPIPLGFFFSLSPSSFSSLFGGSSSDPVSFDRLNLTSVVLGEEEGFS